MPTPVEQRDPLVPVWDSDWDSDEEAESTQEGGHSVIVGPPPLERVTRNMPRPRAQPTRLDLNSTPEGPQTSPVTESKNNTGHRRRDYTHIG